MAQSVLLTWHTNPTRADKALVVQPTAAPQLKLSVNVPLSTMIRNTTLVEHAVRKTVRNTMKHILMVVSIVLAIALGLCWLIYPCMIFGTSRLDSLWYGGLGLAAVAASGLLVSVVRYGWLTIRGRSSGGLLIITLGVCVGFIALWLSYFRFLERMP